MLSWLGASIIEYVANPGHQGQVGDDQQEDCLNINVWSKPQSGSARKPVLVWIYGGGFQDGGTNTTAYGGQFWADVRLIFSAARASTDSIAERGCGLCEFQCKRPGSMMRL